MASAAPQRVRDDLVRLVDRGRSVHDFSLEAARILGRAVPFDGVCVVTMDPSKSHRRGAIESVLIRGATLGR